MATTGLTARFDRQLLRERLLTDEINKSREAIERAAIRMRIQRIVKDAGVSGDLDLILAIERRFIENDLAEYANSKGMTDSLTAALAELASAERHVWLVRDPVAYRALDQTYSLPKNRLPKGKPGAVPHDEARQFFLSHATRLANQDRSRLDAEEKQLLDQRRANIRAAEALYAGLQRRALAPEAAEA